MRRHRAARCAPLLIIVLTLPLAACSWFKRAQPVSERERAELNREIRSAAEQSGGDEVWVKDASRRPGEVDVLAATLAFDRVVEAIKGRAEKQGYRASLRRSWAKDRWRAAEVRAERDGHVAASWRIREVPRLLRAAIVIDDLGQDLDPARKLLAFPYALTFSVLPALKHSGDVAAEAHGNGREVMLHLPMEAEPGAAVAPGAGSVRVGMRAEAVARVIESDLSSVPFARGANNHMGSRATADPRLMAEVMRALSAEHLYFIDSRTTGASVALAAARRLGVPCFYRSVFLDDTETVDYTLGQLRQFRRVIAEQGAALAIGHPHPTTIRALAEFLPTLEREDIRLVAPSELVRLPEVARLSPSGAKRK